MIVFLQCNTNNRALTVLTLFLGALGTYGLPSRVRSDKGGGGVGKKRLVCTVYAYAIGLRSPDRGDNSLLGNAICKTVPFFFMVK